MTTLQTDLTQPQSSALILEKTVVFLGAFLLFWMELFFAKMLLPQYGGSPAVWVTCLACYQILLFLGYAYVARFSRHPLFKPGHIALIGFSSFWLPLSIRSLDTELHPILQTVQLVILSIGVPFLVLCSTSPLIQFWRSRSHPYSLYAWSNAGSLISLILYPLVLEPRFGLLKQSLIWSGVYFVFGVLFLVVAIGGKRKGIKLVASTPIDAIPTRQKIKWLIWAAIPTAMLSGATTYSTMEIAPDPLLWAFFLGLYLVSFILPFLRSPLYEYPFVEPAVILLTILLCGIRFIAPPRLDGLISFVALCFFLTAWAYHSRLSHSRPHPQQLTEFYFWLSLGGMVGGIFAAIIAPLALKQNLDFHYLLAVSLVVLPLTRFQKSCYSKNIGVAIGVVLILCLTQGSRIFDALQNSTTIAQERSFFGAYSVFQRDDERMLMHGMVIHGIEVNQDNSRPTSYYTAESPIADLMNQKPETTAVVGMGAGALAAYVPDKTRAMTFYEIDPLVGKIASQYFSFINKPGVDAIFGDGRLELAASSKRYDLIILDAFNSDSIPVHLLTLEALQLYLDHLKPGGKIAIHTTVWFVDLPPIISRQAQELNVTALMKIGVPTKKDKDAFASQWVVVGKSAMNDLSAQGWKPVPPSSKLWTDDFSSVFSARRVLSRQ